MQTEEAKHLGKMKQVLIISVFLFFFANHKAFFSCFFGNEENQSI